MQQQLLKRLQEVEDRLRELEQLMLQEDVIRNPDLYQKYAKEHAELKRIAEPYRRFKALREKLLEAESLLEDPDEEIRRMAAEEKERLMEELERVERELKVALLPRDPRDERLSLIHI